MKTRIISAIIMAIICIPLIIIGGLPSRIGIGLIGILAYKEIIDIKGFKKYPKSIIIIGLLNLLILTFSSRDILYKGAGLDYRYIVGLLISMLIPTVFYYGSEKYSTTDAFKLSSFILFLGLVLNIISNILIYEKTYFFLILLITILTDSFAFFIGKAIGKHKITKISPNKSIEGYIGGVIMGTILSSIYYMTFIGNASLTTVIPALIIMSIVCELGDLFYSLIKREVNIKDFSNLIKGHGGIMDRIDSLTFVTLAYVLLRGLI